MKFSETDAEAHPILAAPRPVQRKEIALAFAVAVVVGLVLGLITAAVLVDTFGGRLLFGS